LYGGAARRPLPFSFWFARMLATAGVFCLLVRGGGLTWTEQVGRAGEGDGRELQVRDRWDAFREGVAAREWLRQRKLAGAESGCIE
jgi:hypothetical protein